VTDNRPADHAAPRPAPAKAVYLMVFFSGFAGLVYQVLWMRQLGFLFGNTSHAAAATLSAFFAGLAAGSRFWGKRSGRTVDPLRVYAYLQAGIAATALLYFAVLGLFYLVYPPVYRAVGSGGLLLAIKFILALLLVFPPSFCMGGTIPVIGQFLIKDRDRFGTTSALLYGVNTLGAGLGAFLTGFYFPILLGFNATCALAMVITGAVSAAAFLLSRRQSAAPGRHESSHARRSREREQKRLEKEVRRLAGTGDRWTINVLCFLSGFGVLALEVLWTRLFAQIHENSVYSFASVLVIVLVCLALGALVASRLARLDFPPMRLMAYLMIAGGIAISISPFLVMWLTADLQMMPAMYPTESPQDIPETVSFLSYTLKLFLTGFASVGVVALVLGTVFPFLMKTEEKHALLPGDSLGRLSAVNTVGAILGSLLCGFVFLEIFGMWRTMQLVAAAYLVAGAVLPWAWEKRDIIAKAVAGASLLLLLTVLSPVGLPVTGTAPRLHPDLPQESVIEVREASDCTVSVVALDGHDYTVIKIKINSSYSLGSTGAAMHQESQGRIPLFIYPETKSVFFLGLGTGITAGASLERGLHSVKRVVACELVPEVIAMAKKYMTGFTGRDLTNGLFDDPRVGILAEDGRHFLMATDEKFDMINADLFLPYRSGAGSLYSREHFESAKKRLNPGGVFVQWLPLYQISEDEFGVIARTMLKVFDQVTMWRETFQPGAETVALVGHRDAAPLPPSTIDASAAKIAAVEGLDSGNLADLFHSIGFNGQTVMFFYCGNVTAAKELFADYPVNTDDRPLVEYMTPRSLRREDELTPKLVGPKIAELVDEILAICPPGVDPMLMNRTAENRRLPVAGAAFHRAWIEMVVTHDREQCRKSWDEFVREWTNRSSGR